MSEIRATTISDAAGTGPITLTGQSAAKAWVNFNSITTVSIRESLNVASLTDVGVGDTAVNLSNSMATIDYSVLVTSEPSASLADNACYDAFTVRVSNSFRVLSAEANALADSKNTNVSVKGDLA
jgi:hypothetical protein